MALQKGRPLMAWETSDRRTRLPADWARRRLRVLRRDGYRCQARTLTGVKCNAPAGEVDHIEHGDDHAESNLRAICKPCHARKTEAERLEGLRLKGRKRPTSEKHPGLVAPSTLHVPTRDR